MITEEEIKKVAQAMKINIHDHKEFVEKVHVMIDYFEILDSAGVDDEDVVMHDIPLSSLREDKHIPCEDSLIDKSNGFDSRSSGNINDE